MLRRRDALAAQADANFTLLAEYLAQRRRGRAHG